MNSKQVRHQIRVGSLGARLWYYAEWSESRLYRLQNRNGPACAYCLKSLLFYLALSYSVSTEFSLVKLQVHWMQGLFHLSTRWSKNFRESTTLTYKSILVNLTLVTIILHTAQAGLPHGGSSILLKQPLLVATGELQCCAISTLSDWSPFRYNFVHYGCARTNWTWIPSRCSSELNLMYWGIIRPVFSFWK